MSNLTCKHVFGQLGRIVNLLGPLAFRLVRSGRDDNRLGLYACTGTATAHAMQQSMSKQTQTNCTCAKSTAGTWRRVLLNRPHVLLK